jgi:hypothetical protein
LYTDNIPSLFYTQEDGCKFATEYSEEIAWAESRGLTWTEWMVGRTDAELDREELNEEDGCESKYRMVLKYAKSDPETFSQHYNGMDNLNSSCSHAKTVASPTIPLNFAQDSDYDEFDEANIVLRGYFSEDDPYEHEEESDENISPSQNIEKHHIVSDFENSDLDEVKCSA